MSDFYNINCQIISIAFFTLLLYRITVYIAWRIDMGILFTHQKAHFSEEMKDFNQTITYPGDISGFRKYLKHHPEYFMKYSFVADETSNDRNLMERLLRDAVDFVKYSGCSLYCGEYGVIDFAPPLEAIKWTKDLLAILDANHIGHALWNYKALDFGLLDLDGNIVSEDLLHFIIGNNRQ